MKTTRTVESLRNEVTLIIAEHIAARVKTHPDGPVTLRAGVDAMQQARGVTCRWQRNACEVFLLLQQSDKFLTTNEIARELGLDAKTVKNIWTGTIGGTAVPVYKSANGEPIPMLLFRYKKERAFAMHGKNAVGELVKPGKRLMLATKKGLGYKDGQNVHATTSKTAQTFADNVANAANAIASGSKREAAEWEAQRTEVEAQKHRGEQVTLLIAKTGTDGGS